MLLHVHTCFELVGYERLLDYSAPLTLAPSDEDAGWVKDRVDSFAPQFDESRYEPVISFSFSKNAFFRSVLIPQLTGSDW